MPVMLKHLHQQVRSNWRNIAPGKVWGVGGLEVGD